MKYAVSYSSVRALSDLAEHLKTVNGELRSLSTEMQTKIAQLGPSIGIFEDQLNSLVSNVQNAQSRGEEGIDLLIQKLKQLASQLEEIINRGLS